MEVCLCWAVGGADELGAVGDQWIGAVHPSSTSSAHFFVGKDVFTTTFFPVA